MSVLTTFIVKKNKAEPNQNLEKTNRTVSSEPRVTDILINRGSPIMYVHIYVTVLDCISLKGWLL